MKLAGNKLKHLQTFYHTQLQEYFDAGEIRALFQTSIEHYLGWSAVDQIRRQEENLNQSDLLKIYDCAKALAEGQPLQYILKEAWFYGLPFYVDASVLIPRPETEELVDLLLKENKNNFSLLDIGTGSGCIPISIKKHRPQAEVIGCDISSAALDVASRNAQKLQTQVEWKLADVLSVDFPKQIGSEVEIIISNPPYILHSEAASMAPHVLDQEPHLALFAEGDDAIIFYKKIIEVSDKILSPKGQIYFELNPFTAVDVRTYAETSGFFSAISILKDLSGKSRFMRLTKH